jgi:YD repeat-containing protein
MPRQWLSFWDEETRAGQGKSGTGRTRTSDADIYVPFGQDKLAKGDSVYRVAVVEGELWFFGRVIVGRMAEDPEHAESLDVWAEPGTETTWCEDDCEVDESVVDELVYLDADGTEHRVPRDGSGRLVGDDFQGGASLRELVRGSKALDQFAERSGV